VSDKPPISDDVKAVFEYLYGEPNIWIQSPVSVRPHKSIVYWFIAKIVSSEIGGLIDTYHFVGIDIDWPFNGAVSSEIKSFDASTMTGVTRSGRVYELVKLPDSMIGSRNSHYTLNGWCLKNRVMCKDATQEFCDLYKIDLQAIADKLKNAEI
jgi:hypothetical protein